MDWLIWVSFTSISLVNIVTPGPANLNVVRRAMQVGLSRIMPAILGNAVGLALGGVVCAVGIVPLLRASDTFWLLFRWLGVLYLAWLGIKLICRHEQMVLDAKNTTPVRPATLFREALLLASTNPKALLFYVALFPQVIDLKQAVAPQASLLVLTYCTLSILSLSTYASLAQIVRGRFMTQTRYDRFRRISGIVLLWFAATLLQ